MMIGSNDRLLTPSEVAAMFAVRRATVIRWAREGRLRPIRTLGGQHRFAASEVRRVLAGGAAEHG
jgi:excisionase family DNA binding protein